MTMSGSKVIDLTKRIPAKPPKTLGRKRRRGFTPRDLAFLARVYLEGFDRPVKPVRGEKAAAERLRKAGWLQQREGAEDLGYLLTTQGERLLDTFVTELEQRDCER